MGLFGVVTPMKGAGCPEDGVEARMAERPRVKCFFSSSFVLFQTIWG